MKVPKGYFITLEGGEGSGKSTLVKQLAEELTKKGYDVVTTREPGGTKLGEEIRQWLLTNHNTFKIGTKAELLLFLAARAQHIEEVIRPALKTGKIVICDRFNDSTLAYQGAARGLKMNETRKLCDIVCGEIQPQLTLFLDVDPNEGLRRAKKTIKKESLEGELDRIEDEKIEFHQMVREGFLALAKREPLRISRINANLPQIQVFKEALLTIDELLLLPAKQTK
ncbi:MAG: dTMP kinase [Parachlamydiaceae bacterium]|nr:dTMP kinase [Parachlamydiaceae bacterium]